MDIIHIYDVIVLGLGAHGSSALYYLSKQSSNVLGLERFEQNHKNGSSHGDTRVIRKAYFQDQYYVPIVSRAYDLWSEVEQSSGIQLLHRVGGLFGSVAGIVPEDKNVLKCKYACDNYGVEYKIYTNSHDINKDFRYFNFPNQEEHGENFEALYEYEAGYLNAESCVRSLLDLARKNGAKTIFNCHINKVVYDDELGCYVFSEEKANESSQRFYGKKIVIACGAYINEILESNFNFRIPLEIHLNYVHHFKFLNKTDDNKDFQNIPIFILQLDKDNPLHEFYGFPDINNGYHFKLSLYPQNLLYDTTKDINREHRPDILENVKTSSAKIIRHFKEGNVELVNEDTCLYVCTPDLDFVIDYLPNTDNRVVICSSCSGHGFKFSTVIGENIQKLIYGECEPYERFKIERFGDCFVKKEN